MSAPKSRPGRRSVPQADAREIKARLRRFTKDRFSTRAQFENRSGIPHTTVTGWFGEPPRVPDTSHLIAMGKDLNLNINWLLLGEGGQVRHGDPEPELRAMKVPYRQLAEEVRVFLAAELEIREDRPSADIDTVLPAAQEILLDLVTEYQAVLKDWREAMKEWRKKMRRAAEWSERQERSLASPGSLIDAITEELSKAGPPPTPPRSRSRKGRSTDPEREGTARD